MHFTSVLPLARVFSNSKSPFLLQCCVPCRLRHGLAVPAHCHREARYAVVLSRFGVVLVNQVFRISWHHRCLGLGLLLPGEVWFYLSQSALR